MGLRGGRSELGPVEHLVGPGSRSGQASRSGLAADEDQAAAIAVLAPASQQTGVAHGEAVRVRQEHGIPGRALDQQVRGVLEHQRRPGRALAVPRASLEQEIEVVARQNGAAQAIRSDHEESGERSAAHRPWILGTCGPLFPSRLARRGLQGG